MTDLGSFSTRPWRSGGSLVWDRTLFTGDRWGGDGLPGAGEPDRDEDSEPELEERSDELDLSLSFTF